MKKEERKKVVAIICEFNPMHTGHLHIISAAKKITSSEFCVGLMSGNFSQRSEPCVLNKYDRAEIAAKCGMDLVIGLPTAFCTNNAEIFALSSIKILNELGVDFLAFGCEISNEQAFFDLAKFQLSDNKTFKKALKKHLDCGLSYNSSTVRALEECKSFFREENFNDAIQILQKPNSVLALEYVKALLRTKSKIRPVFVPRVDNYNSSNNIENFVSSSCIRNQLLSTKPKNIEFLPACSHQFFENYSINFDLFSTLVLLSIKLKSAKELSQIYGTGEGLEFKLLNEAKKTNCFQTFFDAAISKRYKANRIKAIVLNSQLGITSKLVKKIYAKNIRIFVKALAFNSKSSAVLGCLNTRCVVVRKNDLEKLHFDAFNRALLRVENNANSLYNIITKEKQGYNENVRMWEDDFVNKVRII